MPWLALSVDIERAAADAFSDALLEAGAQSVSVDSSGVQALLRLTDSPQTIVAAAAANAAIAPPSYRVEKLDDEDWVRASQAQFEPIAIGKRLWIGASWHEPPPGRIAVRIDPGLAFGTGSHASTRLVLRFLDAAVQGGERILDYGCGSGILAIAAAKLGAAQVDGVDVDPQAVETTLANARANGIRMNAMLPDALAGGGYDLVLANILAQPLIVLAPLLARRSERIALSGILDSQADEVARAYAPWFRMHATIEEGWALLVGERPLVTRCPKCGTAFRVQRDQLAVRSGAVRCGKCGEVFDGVAALVDEGADRLWVEPSPQLGLFDPSRRPAPAPAAPAAEEPLPEFLIEQPEPSRWRAWLWSLLCLAALAALGAQVYRLRTEITVVVPELRPVFEAGCRLAGCVVPLPRRPELIRIVSDDMQDDRDRQVYVLNALLRNVARFPQPYPDIELTLTEAGKPITRRVLRPAEYAGARAAAGFEAGGEEPLRVYIDARALRASGYELCIYPHDCVKKPTR